MSMYLPPYLVEYSFHLVGRNHLVFHISSLNVSSHLAAVASWTNQWRHCFLYEKNDPLWYVYVVITIYAIFVCFVFCVEMLIDLLIPVTTIVCFEERRCVFVTLCHISLHNRCMGSQLLLLIICVWAICALYVGQLLWHLRKCQLREIIGENFSLICILLCRMMNLANFRCSLQ